MVTINHLKKLTAVVDSVFGISVLCAIYTIIYQWFSHIDLVAYWLRIHFWRPINGNWTGLDTIVITVVVVFVRFFVCVFLQWRLTHAIIILVTTEELANVIQNRHWHIFASVLNGTKGNTVRVSRAKYRLIYSILLLLFFYFWLFLSNLFDVQSWRPCWMYKQKTLLKIFAYESKWMNIMNNL